MPEGDWAQCDVERARNVFRAFCDSDLSNQERTFVLIPRPQKRLDTNFPL